MISLQNAERFAREALWYADCEEGNAHKDSIYPTYVRGEYHFSWMNGKRIPHPAKIVGAFIPLALPAIVMAGKAVGAGLKNAELFAKKESAVPSVGKEAPGGLILLETERLYQTLGRNNELSAIAHGLAMVGLSLCVLSFLSWGIGTLAHINEMNMCAEILAVSGGVCFVMGVFAYLFRRNVEVHTFYLRSLLAPASQTNGVYPNQNGHAHH